ncbi:MAG: YccF domain-containing protein [Candidatus Cyclobacteriaceae bacterium M2_1C_046]
MGTIGNILWFIFGGFIISLLYLLGSLVLFVTIIGIPFGIQTLKLAVLGLAPFDKEIVRDKSSGSALSVVMNIIWIILPGLELAVVHFVLGILCAVTIIGIPFAKQHFKLMKVAFIPFGYDIK